MTRLTVHTIPPIVLGAHEIISITGKRRALGGESPVLTVTLDNALGQLTQLFSVPPLRHRAQLDDGTTGVVQSCAMSSTIVLTLET